MLICEIFLNHFSGEVLVIVDEERDKQRLNEKIWNII
jgi:hypothetical protein